MSAVAATLAAVEIGRPLNGSALALFPLFSDGPSPPRTRPAAPPAVPCR
jgi:hypothetical protein